MVTPERSDAQSAFLRLQINQLRPSVRASPNALANLLDHIATLVGGHAVVLTAEGRMIGRAGVPSVVLKAYRSVTQRRCGTVS